MIVNISASTVLPKWIFLNECVTLNHQTANLTQDSVISLAKGLLAGWPGHGVNCKILHPQILGENHKYKVQG